MGLLDQTALRERIERLAAIERPSASAGEAEAARIIADELAAQGARVSVEEERAHGTYWWPVGLMCAAATIAGFRRRRALPALVAGAATAGVIDDISGGRLWFRRTFLPRRTTTNVVAEMGPADASRTIVVISHHDAAHSGLVFHPEATRAPLRRFPHLKESMDSSAPVMWGSFGGPAAVALGAAAGSRLVRVLGALMSLGYTLAMADIGLRKVVPGANDNLSAVGVVLSLAHSLREEPIDDTRIILLSTGSEESFMEGMHGFARRHFGSLDPERTTFVCLESVGSPTLLPVEGEGMVWMNHYPKGLIAEAAAAAREAGVELRAGLKVRAATDGLIPLRAGYPTVTIGSVDEFNMPTNYHWPTDTADGVHYDTVEDCARLTRRLLERLAARREPARDAPRAPAAS